MNNTATEFDEHYTDYQLKRNLLRRAVRRLYLNRYSRLCKGNTLDFGCGIGELLALLPRGSLGLEVNPASVRYCKSLGLNVEKYDYLDDGYKLKNIPPNTYSTFTINHVLEHLENPDQVLFELLKSTQKLNFERFILNVPGKKGFSYDITHKTFIDLEYLKHKGLLKVGEWKLAHKGYFPGNFRSIGDFFTHHELTVIFER